MAVQHFLGLDSSTQSLSATIIEVEANSTGFSSKIIYETSINFQENFGKYGVKNGVLPDSKGIGEAFSPPQMWVEALDLIFQKMLDANISLSKLKAIGVSGQQHGSVYLNSSADSILANLTPQKNLAEQLANAYSRELSPIWMDSSTSEECAEITEVLGGPKSVCEITGSECFERFTGPQIRKFYKQDSKGYQETQHICLVSSFVPSILAGKIVGIDPGDGAGMNLMDIRSKAWSADALRATAPDLGQKLFSVTPSDAICGKVSNYFVEKYSVAADCEILPGTGDNPSSLIGLGLVVPGRIGISLGTSDTLFAAMKNPNTDPTGASHVFGSPAGDYMVLACYKNGSLARENIKDEFGASWDEFSKHLNQRPAGNNGCIILPYFDTEIVPRVPVSGVQKYNLDNAGAAEHIRAVVEAQMTSMALHSEWMGEAPQIIYVTGGASSNKEILQVMADVFNAKVARQTTTNAAGLGAALRAHHAFNKASAAPCEWTDIVKDYVPSDESQYVSPIEENVKALKGFRESYRKTEKEYLEQIKAAV